MTGEYLLSIKGVSAKVSLSAARIYELVKEGAFPLPCGIGGASRWRGADVDSWILEVAAQPRKVRTVSGLGQSQPDGCHGHAAGQEEVEPTTGLLACWHSVTRRVNSSERLDLCMACSGPLVQMLRGHAERRRLAQRAADRVKPAETIQHDEMIRSLSGGFVKGQ